MKLTKEQKAQLKNIKKTWGAQLGLKFIHNDNVVTICWTRVFKGSKMIAVSTSYYDEGETDRFRRKTGQYFSAMRMSFEYQQLMLLPLGHLDDRDIETTLYNMFFI